MKLHSASRLLAPLAAIGVLMMGTPTFAGRHASSDQAAKAAKPTPPDVKLPFTFTCPDCHMTITIKVPADWNKDCATCACGKSNLGCYQDIKK